MLRFFLQLFRESSYRSAFFVATKYVRPELLMAALYAAIWIDPFVFGQKTFEGLSWGLWLEFLTAHAHTGTAVVGVALPTSRPSGKIAVGLISLFYLVFVVAISVVMGSILTVVFFIILSIKRITMPGNTDMVKEILYAFFKVMIFLITAAIGAGIAAVLPAQVTDSAFEKGAEIVPAWGVCYFVALYFYEDKIAQRFFRNELRPARA